MRNKGFVIVLGIVITLLCLYYLSFTFVSQRVEKDAVSYATDASGSLSLSKKQNYLDSIWNKPVYNLFGAEFTYKEVKENELSLGAWLTWWYARGVGDFSCGYHQRIKRK